MTALRIEGKKGRNRNLRMGYLQRELIPQI